MNYNGRWTGCTSLSVRKMAQLATPLRKSVIFLLGWLYFFAKLLFSSTEIIASFALMHDGI